MAELSTVKETKQQMNVITKILFIQDTIKRMNKERENMPSVEDLQSLRNRLAMLEREKDHLTKENCSLENQIMIMKNQTVEKKFDSNRTCI
jgi:hypothetical protein